MRPAPSSVPRHIHPAYRRKLPHRPTVSFESWSRQALVHSPRSGDFNKIFSFDCFGHYNAAFEAFIFLRRSLRIHNRASRPAGLSCRS